MLVIDGAMLREVVTGSVVAMELLGPGDVLVPAADDALGSFVEADVRWSALLPTQLAIMTPELVQRLSDWPGVLGVMVRRMAERSARQAVMQAICHHPRVDARLRGLFWHLADRWGRVTPNGVLLPLRLTHESLAHLIGAQRPTVSTALKTLADDGEITRRRDGSWVLLPASHERLAKLQHRVATVRAAIEVIEPPTERRRAMREQLERLQNAWEQQSASIMMLRQRSAQLRADAEGLADGLKRFRTHDGDQDGTSGS
jgi:DNA-binding transcriptional ArsR family regulator